MTDAKSQNTAAYEVTNQNRMEKVLLSSQAIGWQGVVVETRLHSGGEFCYSSSRDHLISLHLGSPVHLERGGSSGLTNHELITQGGAIVVPAGQPSLWRHTDASYFLNIKIAATLLERIAERLTLSTTNLRLEATRTSFHDPHLQQLALLLRWELEAGAPHGNLYAETIAEALCIHLLQRGRSQSQPPALVPPSQRPLRAEMQQAVTYIQDNLAADLSIDTIARAVGLSPYHFARMFTQSLGSPPRQYIIEARIERAKVLLKRHALSPVIVTHLTGFADQSHFTRHFKRLVGVTPRVFATDTERRNIP